MSGSTSSLDAVTMAILWLLLLSLFNVEDDVARWMGEFAQNVIVGFNGG